MKQLVKPAAIALALAIPAVPAAAADLNLGVKGKTDAEMSAGSKDMKAGTEMKAGADASANAGSGVKILHVDVVRIATGYRASEVIGKDVYNDANEEIGEIEDLIVSGQNKVVHAIVGVGGFLGLGERRVAVPYSSFSANAEGKLMLHGITKADLENAPEFKYRD